MKNKIKIPTLNNGKEFEIPPRKVKHTHYILTKTLDSPERIRGYDISYHTAYIMLKEIFPNLEYKDIDELDDKILVEINDIVWGKPERDFQVDPAV
jgi:hypothetical protein